MAVLGYQIGILSLIVISSILFGEAGLWLAVAASAIWTIVMVFTSWLMILQFVTIFLGLGIGAAICGSSGFKKIQGNAWGLIVAAVIGGFWLYNKNQENSPASSQPPQMPVQAATVQPRTPTRPPVQFDTGNYPATPAFPNGDSYGAVGLDPREMQRMTEEARQAGKAFDAAQRACGSAPTYDMSAFDRWGACMSRYGF